MGYKTITKENLDALAEHLTNAGVTETVEDVTYVKTVGYGPEITIVLNGGMGLAVLVGVIIARHEHLDDFYEAPMDVFGDAHDGRVVIRAAVI
jgi:hypothetical protein